MADRKKTPVRPRAGGDPPGSPAQSKVHQTGADSWSRSDGLAPGMAHPAELRRTALRIAGEGGLSNAAVARALEAETGQTVAPRTVGTWRRTEELKPGGLTVANLANRALSLVASELRRIEAQAPASRDLNRLSSAVAILKTIEPMMRSKTSDQSRSLTDLSDATRATSGENQSHFPGDLSSFAASLRAASGQPQSG